MIGTDGPVTQEERETLRTQKNSEVFRIARKIISNEFNIRSARFGSQKYENANEIFTAQGVLQGLLAAYNLIMSGTVDK